MKKSITTLIMFLLLTVISSSIVFGIYFEVNNGLTIMHDDETTR